jgi:hypothetical protein
VGDDGNRRFACLVNRPADNETLAVATSASRWNLASRSGSAAKLSGRILSATSRFNLVSRARYTSPIPPTPMTDWISYGPRRKPGRSKGVVLEGLRHSSRHGFRIQSSGTLHTDSRHAQNCFYTSPTSCSGLAECSRSFEVGAQEHAHGPEEAGRSEACAEDPDRN